MYRRQFLTLASALALSPLALRPLAAQAEPVMYSPGLAEAAMKAGDVVLLDFWASWCSTCAAQGRVLTELRAENPAYEAKIKFFVVDWDLYGDKDLSRALKIPRRSTLVALKGQTEIARIVAGTGKKEIKALLDQALASATA